MKPLLLLPLLAVALAAPARAAVPCQLSEEDRAQLAASPAKLASPEAIEALPADKKAKMCKSIRTVHSLQNGAKLKSSSDASSYYLGPDYAPIYADALDSYLNDLLASKGIGKVA
ncbi:MAG: hypothetical protein HY079_04775 [Elusimicrobia bacterium]|nr:hypothetical protein [Elusimicrobiota bacterium]